MKRRTVRSTGKFGRSDLSTQLSIHCYSQARDIFLEEENGSYDYIVIGSGPGGATVATRLALNNFRVLLIEAGPDYEDGTTKLPAFWPLTQLNPLITAQFNPYLFSEEDNITIEYPRGLTLGGSSQIHGLVTTAANPSEWDYIAQVTNDPSWNQQNMAKYQKLVENCQYCTKNRKKNGWLNISTTDPSKQLYEENRVVQDLLKNVRSQLPYNQDINEKNSYDCSFNIPKSVDENTGTRSAAYQRIKNVQTLKPSYLDVWTNTFVTKLILDRIRKKALGVEYVKGSNLYKAYPLSSQSLDSNQLSKSSVYAKREVIVSGGQWMTPQLLQLSGIGNEDLLNKYSIEKIQHLPGVGQNQQDRNELPFVLKLKSDASLNAKASQNCTFGQTPDDPCLIDFLINPKTSFYSFNLILQGGIHSTKPIVKKFPDTSFILLATRFTGFRKNFAQTLFQFADGTYLTASLNLAHNLSQLGTVEIQSTNAFDPPLIQLNHFKGPNQDIELNRIIQTIRFFRQLFSSEPFAQYVDYEDLPGTNLQTDEQLIKYIKEYVWGHHACCTSKMGNIETDPLAVVNSKGQVKGIENLRICDISIFPRIPSYYPVLSILMAAEKIADDIIKDRKP